MGHYSTPNSDADREARALVILEAILELDEAQQPDAIERLVEGDRALRDEVGSLMGFLPLPDDATDAPGMTLDIDGYEILARLDQDGHLYEATHGSSGARRLLVIGGTGAAVSDIERDLPPSAGIARVHDAGTTDDGLPFFVTNALDERPIVEACDGDRLDIPERIDIFRRAAALVRRLHDDGLAIDRLDRSSILVDTHQRPRLAARVIPIADAPDTAAENLEDLGRILFEVVTGRQLERYQDLLAPSEILAEPDRLRHDLPPDLDAEAWTALLAWRRRATPDELRDALQGPIDAAVAGCLDETAFDGVGALLAALDRVGTPTVVPMIAEPPRRASMPSLRPRVPQLLAAAVFAALTVGLVVLLVKAGAAEQLMRQAQARVETATARTQDVSAAADVNRTRARVQSGVAASPDLNAVMRTMGRASEADEIDSRWQVLQLLEAFADSIGSPLAGAGLEPGDALVIGTVILEEREHLLPTPPEAESALIEASGIRRTLLKLKARNLGVERPDSSRSDEMKLRESIAALRALRDGLGPDTATDPAVDLVRASFDAVIRQAEIVARSDAPEKELPILLRLLDRIAPVRRAGDHLRLSDAYLRLGRPEDATAAIEAAMAIGSRYGDADEVITILLDAGKAHRAAGREPAARAAYARALALREQQLEATASRDLDSPAHDRARDSYALTIARIADLESEAGNHREAIGLYQKAWGVRTAILDQEKYGTKLAMMRLLFAGALYDADATAHAAEICRHVGAAAALLDGKTLETPRRVFLLDGHVKCALASGDPDIADARAREVHDLLTAALHAAPDDASIARWLAEAEIQRAERASARGDLEDAIRWGRQATDRLAALADAPRPDVRNFTALAWGLSQLGRDLAEAGLDAEATARLAWARAVYRDLLGTNPTKERLILQQVDTLLALARLDAGSARREPWTEATDPVALLTRLAEQYAGHDDDERARAAVARGLDVLDSIDHPDEGNRRSRLLDLQAGLGVAAPDDSGG